MTSIAEAIYTLSAGKAADAEPLCEARAIAKDNDREAETTTYVFADNSAMVVSGPDCHPKPEGQGDAVESRQISAPVVGGVLAVLDALEMQTRQRGGSPSCVTIASARDALAKLMQEAQMALNALQELASDKCPRTIHALRTALADVAGA